MPDSPLAKLTIDDLHFGMAVCRVDCVACRPTREISQDVSLDNYYTGNYEVGRYGWITENLRVIDPVPVTGKQGIFDVKIND